MKLGTPNQKSVACYVRNPVAINLSALRIVLDRAWCFSLLVDGATHNGSGYFDVRLSFEHNGELYNFHLLMIPTGSREHTAAVYADLVLAVLRDVFGNGVLKKLIGIATDGAATMLGCRRGFSKRIQDACGVEGARGIVVNWCGSHQLNLVVGEFLTLLDEFVDFRSILDREISFTRTHESVSKQLGRCPTYATTRWSSIYDACNYLMQNYSSLQRHQDEKDRIKSSPLWWLCLFMVADLTHPIKLCFQMLQHKKMTTAEQYDALRDLNATLLLRFQDGESDTSPEFSYAKMEQQLCGASPFSRRLFDSLSVETQHKLVDVFLSAVKVLADGSVAIQIEVGGNNSIKRSVGPLEVIACDDGTFPTC